MVKRIQGQTGMSLVEALIILLVLMLLTGVLAPNIFEFVKDAQYVKVKEDCEAIGIETAKLVRDVGPCLQKLWAADGCTEANQVAIMYSRGGVAITGGDALAVPYSNPNGHPYNWDSVDGVAPVGAIDSMEHQFTTNTPQYPTPTDLDSFLNTYPSFGMGWRGAYLSAPIGPDPWGSKYQVNTIFLTAAAYSTTHGFDNDVYCISAGPNQIFETKFGGDDGPQYGTTRKGDDFIFIIQGSTR